MGIVVRVSMAVLCGTSLIGDDLGGDVEEGGYSSGRLMSHRTRWETPRGRYDEHTSKFSLSMKPKFNRPVGEKNHF
jgi:hypothetical protein